MIKNPSDVYIGPKGLTKREFIIIEFAKVLIVKHGVQSGIKTAVMAADTLINFENEDIEDEQQDDEEEED